MYKNQTFQKRYLKNGLSSFDEIEMLEFLLSLRVDNKDHYNLAKELASKYKCLNNIVDESDFELKKISGFQEEYLVGLKLPYHFSNIYLFEKSKIGPVTKSPEDVYNYLIHSMRGNKIEQFNVLYLNSQNQITNNETISNGTVNQAYVFPREIIKSAIKHNSAGLILAHNHPSGNPEPSREDINITNRIKDITKLLEIKLLDHVIIAGDKYLSFLERGLL